MTTDFDAIDFPPSTLSPSTREATPTGWALGWDFKRLVTGNGMGMTMPTPVQPGPLAASMAFSAPISLDLFMVWIYALGLVKVVELHPVNHVFLAATFFSFHLLFGYSSDHLTVELAFVLSSAVSLFLTLFALGQLTGRVRWSEVFAGSTEMNERVA